MKRIPKAALEGSGKVPSRKVPVTQEAIDNALRRNAHFCIIAQALKLIGARQIQVSQEGARFTLGNVRYYYPLPAPSAAKLIGWDNGEDGEPFVVPFEGRHGFMAPAKLILVRNVGKPLKKYTKHKTPSPKRCVRTARRVTGGTVLEVAIKNDPNTTARVVKTKRAA